MSDVAEMVQQPQTSSGSSREADQLSETFSLVKLRRLQTKGTEGKENEWRPNMRIRRTATKELVDCGIFCAFLPYARTSYLRPKFRTDTANTTQEVPEPHNSINCYTVAETNARVWSCSGTANQGILIRRGLPDW